MAKNGYRSRQWSLVTYASVDEFVKLCEQAEHYAYIYHDKDGVAAHYHVLLVFKNPRALKGLQDVIGSDQNTFGEPVKSSLEEMYKYLTHERETDKVIYSHDDLHVDSFGFWDGLTAEEGSVTDAMIDDILSGIKLRLLARRYGRDFMKNHKYYIAFAQLVAAQESGIIQPYEQAADYRSFRDVVEADPPADSFEKLSLDEWKRS